MYFGEMMANLLGAPPALGHSHPLPTTHPDMSSESNVGSGLARSLCCALPRRSPCRTQCLLSSSEAAASPASALLLPLHK
jgi:hypothetical protein